MSRPLDAAASFDPAGPPAQPRPSSSAMAAHLEILAVIDSFAAFARAEAKEALEASDERAVEALNAFLADLESLHHRSTDDVRCATASDLASR